MSWTRSAQGGRLSVTVDEMSGGWSTDEEDWSDDDLDAIRDALIGTDDITLRIETEYMEPACCSGRLLVVVEADVAVVEHRVVSGRVRVRHEWGDLMGVAMGFGVCGSDCDLDDAEREAIDRFDRETSWLDIDRDAKGLEEEVGLHIELSDFAPEDGRGPVEALLRAVGRIVDEVRDDCLGVWEGTAFRSGADRKGEASVFGVALGPDRLSWRRHALRGVWKPQRPARGNREAAIRFVRGLAGLVRRADPSEEDAGVVAQVDRRFSLHLERLSGRGVVPIADPDGSIAYLMLRALPMLSEKGITSRGGIRDEKEGVRAIARLLEKTGLKP